MDDELDLSLEGSQEEYEGNKDATRALMRVKQKLDGYEDGEMRSVNGQVIFHSLPSKLSFYFIPSYSYHIPVELFFCFHKNI